MSNALDPNRTATGYPAANPYPNGGYPPPTGAAPPPSYPYYNNNNHPNNQYYSQSNYQDAARRAVCLRRICALVIGLVIISVTVTFIAWLVLRPQVPQFSVDSFSISNFTLGNDSRVTFTSEIRLTARNPNKKMELVYDHVEAVIFYRSEFLSGTTVPPFSQETRSVTSLTANFAAAGSFVDKRVAEGINGERARNGIVNFNLRMQSRVRFEAKAWRDRYKYLKVFCGDLVVSVPSNGRSGALTGGRRQCRVGV